MGIVIFIILILCALCAPKSKTVTWMILMFMWIIYALNTWNTDYIAYQNGYENLISLNLYTHYEPGYTLLSLLCLKLGLPFYGFRMVLATIYVGLTYAAVRFYTRQTAIALALLMVFPFLSFVSGARAGIASAIVVYSLRYLISDQRKSTIKYIIGIMSATLFHYSSIFFFLFIFAKKAKFVPGKLFKSKKMLALIPCILVVSFCINYSDITIKILSLITTREKTLQWFSFETTSGRPNLMGFTMEMIVLFSSLYVAGLAKRKLSIRTSSDQFINADLKRKTRIASLAYNISVILLLLIPFLAINSTYLRLIYEIIPLIICSCVNAIGFVKMSLKGRNSKRLMLTKIGVTTLLWVIFLIVQLDYGLHRGTNISVLNMFSDNLLFGWQW